MALFKRLTLLLKALSTDTCNLSVFQVSANGNVLRSEIVGSIKMRVFLSGMPELRLGLNDKVLFENTGREFSLVTDFGHAVFANDLSWVRSYLMEILMIINYPV